MAAAPASLRAKRLIEENLSTDGLALDWRDEPKSLGTPFET
jgi:hypothetical protein